MAAEGAGTPCGNGRELLQEKRLEACMLRLYSLLGILQGNIYSVFCHNWCYCSTMGRELVPIIMTQGYLLMYKFFSSRSLTCRLQS